MPADNATTDSDTPLCVLVHGFISGPTVWNDLLQLADEDPDRSGMPEFQRFDYWTKIYNLRPDRLIPTIDSVADQLKTVIDLVPVERPVVLVGHSQGGLVIQRHLARQLRDHQLDALARVERVVLIACPNYGSDKLLPLRRLASRKNAQERELRPFNESVSETHRIVLRDFVSPPTSLRAYSIEWSVFYATQDATVSAASARGGFPHASALDGDHSTVITPRSRDTVNYAAFRAAVTGSLPAARAAETATGPASVQDRPRSDVPATDPVTESATGESTDAPAEQARPRVHTADPADVLSDADIGAIADEDVEHDASTAGPHAPMSLREQVESRRAGSGRWLADVLASLPTHPNPITFRDALLELRRQGVVSRHGFRVRLSGRGLDVFVRVTPELDGVLVRLEHVDGGRLVPFDLVWLVDEAPVDFLTRLDEVLESAGARPASRDVTSWLAHLSEILPMIRDRRARVAGYEDLSNAVQFCAPQWVVYDWGLYATDHPYAVESSRLDELDWFHHMAGKTWVDSDSFYEALTTARELRRNGLLD